jgi:Protein of unknown function (DUF2939)
MARFAIRHWTAILILLVAAGWAVFYLPDTPSFAVFRLKQAIDDRDGETAATHIDFQKVVRNAGYEWLQGKKGGDGGDGDDSGESGGDSNSPFGQLLGRGAIDLFSGPMAALLQRWAIQQVNSGDKQVQMPPAALVGAIVMLHRYGDSAYTRWQDKKGQVYEVSMAREDGAWKIVEVKNVQELLNRLKPPEEKNFELPPEASPVPPPA